MKQTLISLKKLAKESNDYLQLTTKGGDIIVSATDKANTMQLKIGSSDKQVDGSILASDLGAFLTDKSDVSIVGNHLKIGKYSLAIQGEVGFDASLANDTFYTLKSLSKSIDMIFDAMATQDVRYYLNGFKLSPNNLVATDGSRLHIAKLNTGFKSDYKIVSSAFVQLLPCTKAGLKKLGGIYQVSDNYIQWSNGHVTIQSKFINAKYPDVSAYTSVKTGKEIDISKLKSLLESANKIPHTKNNPVHAKFIVNDNTLKVETDASKHVVYSDTMPFKHKNEYVPANVAYCLNFIPYATHLEVGNDHLHFTGDNFIGVAMGIRKDSIA